MKRERERGCPCSRRALRAPAVMHCESRAPASRPLSVEWARPRVSLSLYTCTCVCMYAERHTACVSESDGGSTATEPQRGSISLSLGFVSVWLLLLLLALHRLSRSLCAAFVSDCARIGKVWHPEADVSAGYRRGREERREKIKGNDACQMRYTRGTVGE